MSADGQPGKGLLIAMTAVAAPIAFGLETVLRLLLLPPEFEEFRMLVRPYVTPVGWLMVGLAVVTGLLGVMFQARLVARAEAKLPPEADTSARDRARLGAFMLAASVPQLPAIFATLTFMFGSELLPALVAVGVSTAAVVVQALRAR